MAEGNVVPGMVPPGMDGIRPATGGALSATETPLTVPDQTIPTAPVGQEAPVGANRMSPEAPMPATPSEAVLPNVEATPAPALSVEPPAVGGDVLGSVETGIGPETPPAGAEQPPHLADPGELEARIDPPLEPQVEEPVIPPAETVAEGQPETGHVEAEPTGEVADNSLAALKNFRDKQAELIDEVDRAITRIETGAGSTQQG